MSKNLHPDNHIEEILRNKVLESSLKLPSNAWEAMNELIDSASSFESISQEEAIIQRSTANASVELPANAWGSMSVLLNSAMPSITTLTWYAQAKRRYFYFLLLLSLLPLNRSETNTSSLQPVAQKTVPYTTTVAQATIRSKPINLVPPPTLPLPPTINYTLKATKAARGGNSQAALLVLDAIKAVSLIAERPNFILPTLADYAETRVPSTFERTSLRTKSSQIPDSPKDILAEMLTPIKLPEIGAKRIKANKVQLYATAGANFSYYDQAFFEGNRWSTTTLTTPEQQEIEVLTNYAKNQETSTPVQFYPGIVLGLGTELYISKHFSINPELTYKQKTNINLANTTVLKKGTDIEDLNGQDIQIIKSLVDMQITRQLHFISLPILFNYQLNRHKIMGGVRADFLIREVKQSIVGETTSTINNSQVEILSYKSKQAVMPDKTVFESLDFGLVLGYGFQLSNRFSANARLNYGLKDMTRIQYGEMQGFHRNIDLQLMLRYNLF